MYRYLFFGISKPTETENGKTKLSFMVILRMRCQHLLLRVILSGHCVCDLFADLTLRDTPNYSTIRVSSAWSWRPLGMKAWIPEVRTQIIGLLKASLSLIMRQENGHPRPFSRRSCWVCSNWSCTDRPRPLCTGQCELKTSLSQVGSWALKCTHITDIPS